MTSFSDQYIITIYPDDDIIDTSSDNIIPLIRTLSVNENAPDYNRDIEPDDMPELDEVPFDDSKSPPSCFDSPDEHPPPLMPPVNLVRSITSCPRASPETESDQFQDDLPPKMVRTNTVVFSCSEAEESAFQAPLFVWEFETTDGWLPCNVAMALRCEEEHGKLPLDLQVTFQSEDYSLDLLNGTQTNLRTGSVKKIRRRLMPAAGSEPA